MLTFKPTSLGETLGFGEGIAASHGHSILMEGAVWDGLHPKHDESPLCRGHMLIENGERADDSIGVFQLGPVDIDDDEDVPYLSAVIFVPEEQFLSVRAILLQSPSSAYVQIAWKELWDTQEVIRLRKSSKGSLTIASASVSNDYWSATISATKR